MSLKLEPMSNSKKIFFNLRGQPALEQIAQIWVLDGFYDLFELFSALTNQ